jgi:hypothetical protein
MAEKKTTNDEAGKKAVYAKAVVIESAGQPAEAPETLQQRTVVTSLTQGSVTLRYAPRTPKAAGPVDTTS